MSKQIWCTAGAPRSGAPSSPRSYRSTHHRRTSNQLIGPDQKNGDDRVTMAAILNVFFPKTGEIYNPSVEIQRPLHLLRWSEGKSNDDRHVQISDPATQIESGKAKSETIGQHSPVGHGMKSQQSRSSKPAAHPNQTCQQHVNQKSSEHGYTQIASNRPMATQAIQTAM
ncbi:hypothetical protein ACLOJK_006963 [Asimina triloba]